MNRRQYLKKCHADYLAFEAEQKLYEGRGARIIMIKNTVALGRDKCYGKAISKEYSIWLSKEPNRKGYMPLWIDVYIENVGQKRLDFDSIKESSRRYDDYCDYPFRKCSRYAGDFEKPSWQFSHVKLDFNPARLP